MNKTFCEIFEAVEVNNTLLSYNEYLTVLEALEWKHKSGILTESFNTEDNLVYWVEAVRMHEDRLNEWSVDDFSNAVKSTKEKALTMGEKTLAYAANMIEKFKSAYSVTYDAFLQLGIDLQLGINEVFNTLREKGIWEAIKATKTVAITTISNLYTSYTTAYKETSAIIFGGIDRTKIGELLRDGTVKIQDLVEQNPKLKYLVGPIVAYTLYYIWTKMVFKGDFLYDFDWSTNMKALTGDVDVVNIFSGQGGVELLSWFALGLSGMFPSAAWLDGDLQNLFAGWGNHALAVLATILIYINDKHPKVFDRPLIQAIKNKLCKRDQQLSVKQKGFDTLKNFGIEKGVYKACNGPKCG